MDEFEIYSKLQNLLMTMNKNAGMNQIQQLILKNNLLEKESLLFITMKLLASFVYSRPKQLSAISSILKKIPKFKIDLNMIHFDCDGVYTSQEIIKRIEIIYFLLFNSGHITESEYKNFIIEMNNSFNFLYNMYENRIQYFNVLNLSNDCGSIYKAITSDDIDLLQNVIEQSNFSIEETILFPIFELYDYFKSPILLEYSAFYGSIRCFKYLLIKSENIDFEKLLEYAIAGGNLDIIHITENMSHDVNITKNKKLLYIAISFMQNELIEYIVDVYNIKIDAECYIKCINAANYSGMIILNDLDNSSSINEYGEKGLTPLIDAVYEGFFEFFIFLLSIEKVDYKKKSFFNESIINYAAQNRDLTFIDYIIKNKLFVPNDANLYCYYIVNDVFMHYQNIEEQEKLKYNWIEINDIYNDDDKDYLTQKRFYDMKLKGWRGKRFYSLKRRERKKRFNYLLHKKKRKFIKNQRRRKNFYLIQSSLKELIE